VAYIYFSNTQIGFRICNFRIGFKIVDYGNKLWFVLGKKIFTKKLKTQRFSLWISNVSREKLTNLKRGIFNYVSKSISSFKRKFNSGADPEENNQV